MTMSPLITYEQLAVSFGRCKTPAQVRQYMDENHIAYKTDNRGRPWTTLTALDQHLGVISVGEPVKRTVRG